MQARRVRAEIAGFRNLVDGFISIRPTGEFEDTLRVYEYGQANALLTGGEAWGEVEATDAVTIGARYDFVRGEMRESTETASKGDPLPQIQPLVGRHEEASAFRRGGFCAAPLRESSRKAWRAQFTSTSFNDRLAPSVASRAK